MESNKREMSIEELEKQCKAASETFNALSEQLKKAKKEEEERKNAQLALNKEARKKEIEVKQKEIEIKQNELSELIHAYLKDYGSYSTTRNYKQQDDNGFPYLWHWFL